MTQTTPPDGSAKALFWHHIPRPLLLQLTLLAAVIAVFFPVCGAEFLNYDDSLNVTENYRITDFSLSHLIYFWQTPHENLYIPLTYSLWGLLAKLSKLLPGAGTALHPALFHAMNLILHGGSALTLFHILRLLLNDDWAAGVGALLFAVHPVQVETVAWVTGLKDVLCGFFSMLALWQYLSYAVSNNSGLPWRDKRYLLATLLLASALLSKPGAVTVPLMAALLGAFLSTRPTRRLALDLGPWVILVVPVVLITKLSQPDSHYTFLPALWQRLLIAGDAITFYLGKLLLPLTLGPDYGRTPQYVLQEGWIYGRGLLPYLLAALLFWKYRPPWALAAVGAFTAALLPVLGLVPFDFQDFSTVADRYLYLAMLGPALGLGGLALRYQNSRTLRSVIIAFLLLLGAKSAAQVQVWQNSLVFNTHAIGVNPQSTAFYNNLGIVLKETHRPQEAITAFQKAIAIKPTFSHPYINLGLVYKEIAMTKEALAYYKKALELDPLDAKIYFNLGDLSRDSGNLPEALSYYKMGLSLQPDSAEGYATLGLTYKEMNNSEEAIAAYQKALEIEPNFAEVYSNLGPLYEAEDKEKAMAMYQKALAINPKQGEAANNLGYLYLGLNREKEAIPLFQRAIAAYPGRPLPHNNLGLAYVNLGQLTEAAACFKKALGVDPTFAPALNNLSKIELRLGNIQSALDLADQAKALGFDDQEHFKALQRHRQ